MKIELRPAVYEILALLRFCLRRPESRMARIAGPTVLLLLPFFISLAVLANTRWGPARAAGARAGSWELVWNEP